MGFLIQLRGSTTIEEELRGDLQADIAAEIEVMPLSKFSLSRQVYSRVLQEKLLFAADNATIGANELLVVYRASELKHVCGMIPLQLRAIHATKTALDGELLSGETGEP